MRQMAEDEDWSEVDAPETKIPWFIIYPFWVLVGSIIVCISLLVQIRNNLRDINDATHYTSASVDKLENIENILEDIKNLR